MRINAPLPWAPDDRIHIPEFAALFAGDAMIPAALLGTGSLVLGGTGSGKTASIVIPLLKGLLRHRQDDPGGRFAMLVIDPKAELLDVVRAHIGDPERLVVLGEEGSPSVDFHEGARGSMSPMEAFDHALDFLSPDARRSVRSGGDNQYWQMAGMDLARQLVGLVAAIESAGRTVVGMLRRRDMWEDPTTRSAAPEPSPSRVFMEMLWQVGGFFQPQETTLAAFRGRIAMATSVIERFAVSNQCTRRGTGAGVTIPPGRRDALRVVRLIRRMVATTEWPDDMRNEALRTWFRDVDLNMTAIAEQLWRRYPSSGTPEAPVGQTLLLDAFVATNAPGSSWYAQPAGLLAGLLASLRIGRETRFDAAGKEVQAIGDALRRIARSVGRSDLAEALAAIGSADAKTMFWHADIAMSLIKPLIDPDVARRLHLDPVRACGATVSMADCVEAGRVVVFQPQLLATDADNAFSRTLKQLFFRATLSRRNRTRGVAYIVDEAHRYLTSDEAEWVDICRAHRGIVCLASQSLASIRLAMAKREVDLHSEEIGAAIQVLATNLASKYVFRVSDQGTRELLRNLIPSSPGGGVNLVDARPPTTLRVGECFALLADGSFTRARIRLDADDEGPP
ncbi:MULTISPECIES: hypothetical protein [Candidatus Accumulibacter]|uniref:Type IV secretory pathway, VirD4 component n=2 Tax=Candidatus Accumulibacter TaxID=327159 RepID=A0A080M4Y0_9PROT|nr:MULTISPECIES: hypothetical protein [Candidatus Accumulibacter]KFB76377.1 MAG: Type IV secretory pathway, VirD4 component [Candidatus Accumulibacter cognatus]